MELLISNICFCKC